MNTMYVGMNHSKAPWDDVNVRKAIAMGIDRDRIVKNFYPEGSVVATHFTPCPPLIPFGCEGDDWYPFDAAAAKKLLTDANFDFSKTYPLSFRAAVRPYVPDPPVIASEIKTQLEANLGIKVNLDLQESGTFRANVTAGTYDGLIMYGWGVDYPDVTNFLDFHFGAGSGPKFGGPFDDVATPLTKGATSPADADRQAAYTEANNAIKANVPVVPIAHGANGAAYKADVQDPQASPLTSEIFAAMKASDDPCPSCRAPSRSACTAATSPTASRSGLASRSTSRCTPTRSTAPPLFHRWPPSAPPTPTRRRGRASSVTA